MSVIKRKRKESQFEVFHHFYKVRKDITDLLLRDFGYSPKKAEQSLEKIFGGRSYDELKDSEKQHYNTRKNKAKSFEGWFIIDQRQNINDLYNKLKEEHYV